jgi:hypothetical protein
MLAGGVPVGTASRNPQDIYPKIFNLSCLACTHLLTFVWYKGDLRKRAQERMRKLGLVEPGIDGTAPPGGMPKCENEPEKCFRINKSYQKRTRDEPERTRGDATFSSISDSESAAPFRFSEMKTETNLKRTRGPSWVAVPFQVLSRVLITCNFSHAATSLQDRAGRWLGKGLEGYTVAKSRVPRFRGGGAQGCPSDQAGRRPPA